MSTKNNNAHAKEKIYVWTKFNFEATAFYESVFYVVSTWLSIENSSKGPFGSLEWNSF
jgi:hypothetical protein